MDQITELLRHFESPLLLAALAAAVCAVASIGAFRGLSGEQSPLSRRLHDQRRQTPYGDGNFWAYRVTEVRD